MTMQIVGPLTTSIQAHPLASSAPLWPRHNTMSITAITPATRPQNMPRTARLILCVLPTLNPHTDGKNCEYMMEHITAPCAANKKSLNRTVVSGASGCRYAYCARIMGE
jgi:hypothetical protein